MNLGVSERTNKLLMYAQRSICLNLLTWQTRFLKIDSLIGLLRPDTFVTRLLETSTCLTIVISATNHITKSDHRRHQTARNLASHESFAITD